MRDYFNKIARQLKQGNQQAGELIFDNFSGPLFRFFLVKTGSRETAEDLTQDVFLKLIDKINTFDENLGSFSGWFWQIVRNTVKDYWRKKKSLPLSDQALVHQEKMNFLENKNNLASDIKMNEILDLIKDFDEEEQDVFTLRYLSDMSYREISRILNKSESSLRVLVHRLNKKIRKIITNE